MLRASGFGMGGGVVPADRATVRTYRLRGGVQGVLGLYASGLGLRD